MRIIWDILWIANGVSPCRYLFSCNRWFSVEEDDGNVDRILRLTSKDSMESGIVLRSNLNRKFYEDHLWFSIVFRRCRSSYTRVQRLSTAWALLFLTMIANAMWYKDASETTTQVAFSIGPISFTTYQLYASVVSSLTVVPPVLIITWCYTKACPKDEETKYREAYSKCTSGGDDNDLDSIPGDASVDSADYGTEVDTNKPIIDGRTSRVPKRPKGGL